MNDPDYAKWPPVLIDDEIGMKCPEQNVALRQVFAPVSNARHICQFPKGAVKVFEQAVGSAEAVLRDEFPDLLQVDKRPAG